jgi:adenine/guanine phosphoribosyltransferase-like PRPP-binding protein
VDDVVSTGASLNACRGFLTKLEAQYQGAVCAFTEGFSDPRALDPQLRALGHLPLFPLA